MFIYFQTIKILVFPRTGVMDVNAILQVGCGRKKGPRTAQPIIFNLKQEFIPQYLQMNLF
jgi:hypothetical protein